MMEILGGEVRSRIVVDVRWVLVLKLQGRCSANGAHESVDGGCPMSGQMGLKLLVRGSVKVMMVRARWFDGESKMMKKN
ncbi:hypothetical protein V6N12_013062 [Hibiscus sabdariffa]|uniref:Uncharacterized protein n=1 Tax=Hibiscus sabdariffa TaxID=183260 RepID=A0ABR2EJZ4_9ROSI